MEHELLPLIKEICYIANSRNQINLRRHRARYKKNYYEKALRVVEAHLCDNSSLRYLRNQLEMLDIKTVENVHEAARLRSSIETIEYTMTHIRLRNPKPKKWMTMGLHKIRSLILKHTGEYAMAKHETMEFSIQHRLRMKELLSSICGRVYYDNGSITRISIKNSNTLYSDDIKKYALEYEADTAINKMLS